MIGGALDIGRASLLPLIEARARGIPLQLIVPDLLSNPNTAADGIVVPKNSTIASGKDLNGATLPVPSINDWNFDLEDCDNILRIEADDISPRYIESLLQTAGFDCRELEY